MYGVDVCTQMLWLRFTFNLKISRGALWKLVGRYERIARALRYIKKTDQRMICMCLRTLSLLFLVVAVSTYSKYDCNVLPSHLVQTIRIWHQTTLSSTKCSFSAPIQYELIHSPILLCISLTFKNSSGYTRPLYIGGYGVNTRWYPHIPQYTQKWCDWQ